MIKVNETSTEGADERALYSSKHSSGGWSASQERFVAESETDVDELRSRLKEGEERYLDRVMEKEGEPTVVILKVSTVDGTVPPVYSEMFPFWDKKSYSEEEVRSIEIGYMDKGDTGTELDSLHGRWYKLFELEDFDHEKLEIREGEWRSTEIEFQGEQVTTKEHYEKHLYRYS